MMLGLRKPRCAVGLHQFEWYESNRYKVDHRRMLYLEGNRRRDITDNEKVWGGRWSRAPAYCC